MFEQNLDNRSAQIVHRSHEGGPLPIPGAEKPPLFYARGGFPDEACKITF
ncbi:MAG: hypothetical protein GYA20_11785 [Chloroflexi bacterium]|nr:hypothetical protein [Chloroflexota bacterium]